MNSLNINYFYLLNTKILHSNAYKFEPFSFFRRYGTKPNLDQRNKPGPKTEQRTLKACPIL